MYLLVCAQIESHASLWVKSETVMEPLQQQQKQPHQAPLQMDAREKQNLQTREAQLLYAPKLTTQPTLLSVTPGRPSGSPVLGPLARVTPATPVTQVFEQSSINSEPEEEEGGLEDEDGDDNVAEVAEKEAQAASKYFHVQKATRQDARAAPMSSLPLAPGLPLQGQQAKEDHTKDTSKAPPPIPTAGQSSWNLDEQLKQVSVSAVEGRPLFYLEVRHRGCWVGRSWDYAFSPHVIDLDRNSLKFFSAFVCLI